MTSNLGQLSATNLNNSMSNLGKEQALNEVAVKVAVRVRPLNNREKLHQHQPCVKISSETSQLIIGKDKIFSFDYVLPPKTTQTELYDNCVKSLVHSVFEGYNATVFAYGQTGSGKTHTISGAKSSSDEYGIIPRAVSTMFQIIQQNSNNKNLNRQYCVKVNFIEIYKEELKDLLDSSEKDLQIREDENGNTIIYGANEVVCSSLEEVMACFDTGTMLRHTGSTLMNEQSSRSHSVFTVSIEQRWSDKDGSKQIRESAIYDISANNNSNSYYLGAKFHFVDLAGSERVHRTGNVGDRFKESIHINSGLLALGNVISALSSNDTKKKIHIPYRESKITRILKDSLGGNANTLMICCISPSSCNLDESINALKYASRARYIKNKPIVNMDPETQRFVEMQSEIQALREELHRQRTVISANNQDINDQELKDLESNLQSAKLECDYYKKLVKEAFSRFKQLSTPGAAQNSKKIVDEWLSMFEAVKNRSEFDIEDFTKLKINQLETQLKQAQDDLKSDEEIFADKEKEINSLKEMISDLEQKLSISNRCLEQSLQKEKEQQELMLQLQLQLDKFIQNKENLFSKTENNSIKTNKPSNLPQANHKHLRAKTAPINQQATTQSQGDQDQKTRAAYSSPAVLNLERFMQNFRARSQLLTETLEENDCVLQGKFDSTYEIEEQEENNENKIKNEDQNKTEDEEEGKFVRKGTFKVKKTINRSRLDHAESNQEPQKQLRDLSINIRMKEELIKELVANSKLTNRINLQQKQRIELLEKEINQYKAEISGFNPTSNLTRDLNKTELELKKKLDQANLKINELESKLNQNTKFLNSTSNTDKKLSELELAYTKLKQQNDQLQKKLKEDSDKKIKLEKDFEKEQQKLKELEMRSEKQQQILKKKTEDLAQAQRRLRSGSNSGLPNAVVEDQNKHWVEQEMEKICQEKRQMEIFKDELVKREELIKKKELLLKEKNELEIKKLRSSHSVQLNKNNLEETHLNLVKQRKQYDEKITNGDVLSPAEERRLIEIDEAMDALEIAIEFENDSIRDQQNRLKESAYFDEDNHISESVLQKLASIPYDETKYLVKKFFQKIIDLKEIELKKNLETSELQVQIEEQNKLVEQLKQALHNSASIEQKAKTDKNVKMLTQQLNECNSKIALLEREISLYKEKLVKLKTTKIDESQFASDSNREFFLKSNSNSNALSIESESMKHVKVSRKDLRRLTEEELMKRSLKKEQSHNFNVADSNNIE